MSCVMTHIPLHSLTWRSKRIWRSACKHRQTKKKKKGKPQSPKLPLGIPWPSRLARHDNTDTVPRFSFSTLSGKGILFYYQQRKRSPPSQRLVFLWRWLKAEEGGKHSGGNAEEKPLARSGPLLERRRCATRSLSLGLN